jgi:hypothetical protein
VSERVLTEMVWTMHSGAETEALVWTSREGAPRLCPDCDQTMAAATLEGVAVERCHIHGAWLDAGELQAMLDNASVRPPRSSGIGVDLAPIQIPRGLYGYNSDSAAEFARQIELREWFAKTMIEVDAKTRPRGDRELEQALEPLIAALRTRPVVERPACDAAVALAGRMDEASELESRSPRGLYLRDSKPLAYDWCRSYGVLAEHLSGLSVGATELREYAGVLESLKLRRWALMVAPDSPLAEAHAQVIQSIASHRKFLAEAIQRAEHGDTIEVRDRLDRFVHGFAATEDCLMRIVALCTE